MDQAAGERPGRSARRFPLWPLIGAVVALAAQRVSQRLEFSVWLGGLAIALVAIAGISYVAARKHGRVAATPLGLDVYGPLFVLGFTACASFWWVTDDSTASTVTLTLAGGAFAVIAWGYSLAVRKRAGDFQPLRDRLLVAIGVAAGLGYANFGHLHFPSFIHTWDTYHYYIGAKYFPEVGYERMYECAIVADAEDFSSDKLARMRARRVITNLRSNVMERVDETVLRRPDECTRHFSPARWLAFKKDVAFFRARVSEERWEEIHHDHGYNASPVWTLLGHVIANTGAASLARVTAVDLVDPLYLTLMAAMIWWAFGPRVFAVAMLMLGGNWASRFFFWTGGSLLRHDWLFYTVAVVCLLRRGKPFMAGAALAYASLLRLFPGLLVVGPVLAAVEYARLRLRARGVASAEPGAPPAGTFFWARYAGLPRAQRRAAAWRVASVIAVPAALTVVLLAWDQALGRVAAMLVAGAIALVALLDTLEVLTARAFARAPSWLSPEFGRFVAGGLLATALLVGASLPWFGGLETWRQFAANTAKHAGTPLTNHMGLKTVLSSLPWTSGQYLRSSKELDAWKPWKEKRLEVFRATRSLFVLAMVAGVALLYAAVRGTGGVLWASAALSAGLIVVAAELTNYYYVFFVAIATLHERRCQVGLGLTALVAACIVIMLAPFPGMSGWQDEQSVAMSIAAAIAIGGIWWLFTPWGARRAVESEPAAVLFPRFAAAATPAASSGGEEQAPSIRQGA
jgi:hypothetical protein